MSVQRVELVLLGTGTSAGVPVIGCSCEVCRSSDPRDRRTRSGALLRFTDPRGARRDVLIDCPPDHREQSLRLGLDRCDGILFTHHHVDHTFGLDDVRRYNAIMQAPIEIYADDRTLEHLDRVYRHVFHAKENVNDSFVANLIPRRIEAGRPFELHGVRVTPLDLRHGRVPVLGFRFDDASRSARAADPSHGVVVDDPLPIAYCTDVNSIPPATWRELRGVRTLVMDMLRYRAHPTHFTVDEAIAAAERIGAERTYFVHMTHDIRHADLDSKLPPGMHLGWDGLRIGAASIADSAASIARSPSSNSSTATLQLRAPPPSTESSLPLSSPPSPWPS